MKKILLTMLMLLFIVTFLFSRPVTVDEAAQVARNWMSERTGTILLPSAIQAVDHDYDSQFYIFNIEPAGFVIIAADSAARPVLGYSFENNWGMGEVPPQLAAMMDNWSDQLTAIVENDLRADSDITALWQRYTVASDQFVPERTLRDVAPMLTSTWGQGTYYNDECPVDPLGPDGHVVVGCVAVAMGQIMYFWEHPDQGHGSHSYDSGDYGTLSADFGATTYDWLAMEDALSGYNAEVATLLFHLGVAVEMDYGPDASGCTSERVPPSLINYFKYSNTAAQYDKSDYTEAVWEGMMVDELDAGRPIWYAGSSAGSGGHAFNLDGYQNTSRTIDFHINWGWEGSYDGYYALSSLNPGTYDFNDFQEAVLGIQPSDDVVLLFEGFDSDVFPPTDWTRTQLGTGINWTRATPGADGSAGTAFHSYDGSNTPNSWLISPAIEIPVDSGDCYISFYEQNAFMAWYGYSGIWISDGDGTAGHLDFEELYEADQSSGAFVQRNILIPSEYLGETVYFAFVYSGNDAHDWWVDEVRVYMVSDVKTLTMLDPVGNGTVIPEPGAYGYPGDTVVDLIAQPGLSYFDRWERDGAFYSSDRVTTVTMADDYSVQAFFTLPAGSLTQNFNNENPVPVGWSETNIDNAWQYGDDNHFFTMFDGFTTIAQFNGDATERLVTPTLNLDGSVTEFAFWLAGGNNMHSLGHSTLQLQYKSPLSSIWNNLGDPVSLADGEALQYLVYDLSAIPNGQYHFAFAASSTFNYAGYLSWLGIDNVVGPVLASVQDDDLEVTWVRYPSTIFFDNEIAQLSAEIKNVGLNPQTGTEVTFTIADGTRTRTVLTTNIGTLAYNETEVVTVNYTTIGGRHTIAASVPADDNNANNEATTQGVIPEEDDLAEGFEGDVIGWIADPQWFVGTIAWLPPYEGSLAAYAGDIDSAGFDNAYLKTPLLIVAAGDELNFYASYGNESVGPATLNIEYSQDGVTWLPVPYSGRAHNPTGIVPTGSRQLYTIDLDELVPGEYYLAFRATGSGNDQFATWLMVDRVTGPEVAPVGYIQGTVTLHGGIGNVEDVAVTVMGITEYPDEFGFYQIEITPGTYNVTASLFGYESQTLSDVVVSIGGVTEDVDFDLLDIEIDVDPIGIAETTAYPNPVVTPLEIINAGAGALQYNIVINYDVNGERRSTPVTTSRKSERPDRKSNLLQGNGNVSSIQFSGETIGLSSTSEKPVTGLIPQYESRSDLYTRAMGWNWIFPGSWGDPAVSGVGFNAPSTFYAGAILDLSADLGRKITKVGYHAWDEAYVTAYVYKGNYSSPTALVGESGSVTSPVEDYLVLDLLEPVTVSGDGIYWILIKIEDQIGGFPFGVVSPHVANSGLYKTGDPLTGAWNSLAGMNYSWVVGAFLEGELWISVDQMSGTVPGNDSVVLNVTLDPEELGFDTYNAEIVIHNDAQVEPVVVPVQLTVGVGDPSLASDPVSWHFGDVEEQNPAEIVFVLYNESLVGTVNVTGYDIEGVDAADFALTDHPGFPFSIVDTATENITVELLSSDLGPKQAELVLSWGPLGLDTYRIGLSANIIEEETGTPVGLTADVVNYTNVLLEWDVLYGDTQELIYDNDTVTNIYSEVGSTLATHMTPALSRSEQCQLLTLRYMTYGEGTFNAVVYDWNTTEPGTVPVHSQESNIVHFEWVDVDVSGENIIFTDDFVVGIEFTDIDGNIMIDVDYYNARSWLYVDEGEGFEWIHIAPAVLIRAVVLYDDGRIAEISPQTGMRSEAKSAPATQLVPDKRILGEQLTAVEQDRVIRSSSSERALIGFNIYRDGIMIEENYPDDFYWDFDLAEDTYSYYVEAVYYTGISPSNVATAEVVIYDPLELPLIESWDTGLYSTNYWTRWSNWDISLTAGNPEPAARFFYNPRLTNYSVSLTSWPLNGTGLETINAQFDIFLANWDTTLEQMSFEVFDGTQWQTVATFDNQAGDIPWTTVDYDISTHAANREFQVRFRGHGVDTYSIDWWYIDNIMITALVDLDEPVVTIDIVPDPGVREGDLVSLSWVAIENANSYLIYSSADPYAEFPLEWTLVGQIEETEYEEAVDGIKFYRVQASTEVLSPVIREIPSSQTPQLRRSMMRD